MLQNLTVGLIIAAAVPTAAIATDAPETLTRTGNWVVDYDRDACHLIARFGTGEDSLIMRLTSYEPGETFEASLFARKVGTANARSKVKVDFGLRGTVLRTSRLETFCLGSCASLRGAA